MIRFHRGDRNVWITADLFQLAHGELFRLRESEQWVNKKEQARSWISMYLQQGVQIQHVAGKLLQDQLLGLGLDLVPKLVDLLVQAECLAVDDIGGHGSEWCGDRNQRTGMSGGSPGGATTFTHTADHDERRETIPGKSR